MANARVNMPAAKPRQFQIIIGWILCILIAFVFLMAGGMKLIGRQNMVEEFNQVGLGQWFRYVTGILEVTGAAGILVPRFRRAAALLLATVMVGAIFAHLTVLHSPPTLPAVLLLLVLIAACLRT